MPRRVGPARPLLSQGQMGRRCGVLSAGRMAHRLHSVFQCSDRADRTSTAVACLVGALRCEVLTSGGSRLNLDAQKLAAGSLEVTGARFVASVLTSLSDIRC